MKLREVLVIKQFEFSAAHFITSHGGVCSSVHGHNFKLEVAVTGQVDLEAELPMLVEFKILKNIVNSIIESFDHAIITSHQGLNNVQIPQSHMFRVITIPSEPTAEVIATYICNELENKIKERDLRDHNGDLLHLSYITLCETDRSGVRVYGS